MSVLSIEPITLEAIVHAGKRRWGGEHLVAGETTDGIRHNCWLFIERDNDLHPVCEARSRRALLALVESAAHGVTINKYEPTGQPT